MSSRYYPGMRISCRGEEWQVTAARYLKVANGGAVWEVEARGLTGIVYGQSFIFLSDIDKIQPIDPTDIEPEIDVSRGAEKAKLYWEAHLRRLLPRNGALYIGQHGAVDPYEYQFAPAAQALHLLRPRILIGDAVGLGKTIECGILLSELIRRGRGKRILCAVPKAILEQFQLEMWARFAIPFHRLDSEGLERLRQDLPSTMNPFYHYNKAIISIDTLKIKKYQKFLEHCNWDVLVIDECHNVADRTDGGGGSGRHRVAKRLAERSQSVILMSATPHDGTRPGFASLIKLLDRTKIRSDEEYTPGDFAEHFIRRTRVDVASQISQRGKRKQKIERIPLSSAEMSLLQSLHDGEKRTQLLAQPTRRGARELFKTTLIKAFLSSPQALLETVENKLKRLPEAQVSENQDRASLEEFLRDVKADVEALKGYSRLNFLKDYLKNNPVATDDRLVIFTERLATMKLIRDFLLSERIADDKFNPKEVSQPKGVLVATADGSMPDIDLMALVKSFQASRGGPQILIATNVASEGLNLHKNCHRLIHFDLPWSLITLEQRNGRIDRLGQNKTPEIFYLASFAQGKNRETSAEGLKDDFWIVEKIESRMRVAGSDMDEEAQLKFSDGESEEEEYTSRYQDQKALLDDEASVLASLFGDNALQHSDTAIHRRKLPTLYTKSPADFVRGVCKEAGLTCTEESTEVHIELTKTMRYEIEQWPREFRPEKDAEAIVFEMRPDKMQDHYQQKLNHDELLEKTFLNEIHPAIALLESTAIGFFAGKGVPTVSLKEGDPDTVYFLVQASLFNRCNEVVSQYWQVIEHKKGSPKQTPLFDIHDIEHALKITAWLNERLSKMKPKKDLSQAELDRIKRQTDRAFQLMREQASEARHRRMEQLVPRVREEHKRIKAWEGERRQYLDRIISGELTHQGQFALASRAKLERERIDSDSRHYTAFINDYLATNDDADIRILGCLIVEGSK
jgi:ERCC4-related helicase